MEFKGKDFFDDEYARLRSPEANEEFNKMMKATKREIGNVKDAVKKQDQEEEKKEESELMGEWAGKDKAIFEDADIFSTEQAEVAKTISFIDDILKYRNQMNSMPLSSLLMNLDDEEEAAQLINDVSHESQFYNNPGAVIRFSGNLSKWVKWKILSPNMHLAGAREVLQAFAEENKETVSRGNELTRRAELQNQRKLLFDLCAMIDVARQGDVSQFKAFSQGNEIKIAIEFKNSVDADTLMESLSSAGFSVERHDNAVLVAGLFDERFLKDAKKIFKWVE